jgi:hypothetical protein
MGIPLRPDPDAVRRAGIATLMRAATAHLLALIEGGRPEKIAERNWPADRDVGLLIMGPVSTTTTASAPALVQLSQNFVASLSGAWASAAFLQQTLLGQRGAIRRVPGLSGGIQSDLHRNGFSRIHGLVEPFTGRTMPFRDLCHFRIWHESDLQGRSDDVR